MSTYTSRSFIIDKQKVTDMKMELWRFVTSENPDIVVLQYWNGTSWLLHSNYNIVGANGDHRFYIDTTTHTLSIGTPSNNNRLNFFTNYPAKYWKFETNDNKKLRLMYAKCITKPTNSWKTHSNYFHNNNIPFLVNTFTAGPDQISSINSTNLAAEPDICPEAYWSVWYTQNPSTIVFNDINSETTKVTGLKLGINVLRWTNPCLSSGHGVVSDDVIVNLVNSVVGLHLITHYNCSKIIKFSSCNFNFDSYDFSNISSPENYLNYSYVNNWCCVAINLRSIINWIEKNTYQSSKLCNDKTNRQNAVLRAKIKQLGKQSLTVVEQIDNYVSQLTEAQVSGQSDLSQLTAETTSILKAMDSLFPCIHLRRRDGTVVKSWFDYQC